jgi:hypothetical protein
MIPEHELSDLAVAKRRSSPNAVRGCSQQPHSVAATAHHSGRIGQRVLAVKVDIDWRREESKALYRRLRDLGWMAAHYRNQISHAKWAEMRGWRVDPIEQDKHDATKQIRKTEKGDLSGDAYSCAEQEVQAAWARDGKKILAGQPVPQWKPGAALSISGKEKKSDSGVQLELEGERYILHIRAQSKDSPGGAWLRLPIAQHTRRDEHQGGVLDAMVVWRIPIKKCTIHIEPHGITARLSYKIQLPPLPPMGERIATFGPIDKDGRLLLRTETQTKDYTHKLLYISKLKDSWDLIRRRAKAQIGWRKGHARLKREAIARFALPDKELSCLHMWTREVVDWCISQGVGTIRILEVATGDWPSDRFTALLQYKAEELGIAVEDGADVTADSSSRAARAAIERQQRQQKRRREAIRTLSHQLRED